REVLLDRFDRPAVVFQDSLMQAPRFLRGDTRKVVNAPRHAAGLNKLTEEIQEVRGQRPQDSRYIFVPQAADDGGDKIHVGDEAVLIRSPCWLPIGWHQAGPSRTNIGRT